MGQSVRIAGIEFSAELGRVPVFPEPMGKTSRTSEDVDKDSDSPGRQFSEEVGLREVLRISGDVSAPVAPARAEAAGKVALAEHSAPGLAEAAVDAEIREQELGSDKSAEDTELPQELGAADEREKTRSRWLGVVSAEEELRVAMDEQAV